MTIKLSLTYYGFNYVDYYNGEYSSRHLQSLATVAAIGANSIAETPDFGIDLAADTVYAGGATTDTNADQTAAITTGLSSHLSSFVRPLIDILYGQTSRTYTNPQNYYVPNYTTDPADIPAGVTPATVPASAYQDGDTDNYRGAIATTDFGSGATANGANINQLFGSPTTAGSYDAMIVNEAKLAANAGASLFSIGTELDSLADDTDAAVEKDWTDLIADIRAAAPTLKLTYSANWSNAGQVTFWNKLDYVAIDGYVPLSNVVPDSLNDNNPTLATLTAGWNTPSNVAVAYSGGTPVKYFTNNMSAIDYFDTLAQQSIGKKFIFSEFGYQNDTGAATDPTGGSQTGVLDPTLQTELYQAFFNAWGGAQQTASANNGLYDGIPFALIGAYAWDFDPDSATWNTSAGNYDNWQLNSNALAVFTASVSTTPSAYVWIGGSGTAWQTAAGWNNLTTGANPATAAPGSSDSAAIDGGTTSNLLVTGPGSAASLTVTNDVLLGGASTIGSVTIGTNAAAASLTSSAASATWGNATIVNGTLSASGGTLTVAGTVTLGGAAATNATDYQTLQASGSGALQVGGLVLGLTQNLYTPAYVGVDGTSTLEVGATGGTLATGVITIDPGATISGTGTLGAPVVDNGTLLAQNGTLYALGAIAGSGAVQIASGAGLNAATLNAASIAFAGTGDTLTIGASATSATITGFAPGDTIDLTGVAPGSATVRNDVLTFGGVSYSFAGLSPTILLSLAPDGAGGTMLTATNMFDASFYLAQNPDVKAAGVDPLQHYLTYGWKEGRLPSLTFDGNKYLAANQDVKAAGVDPLVHYDLYGASEGRAAPLAGGTAPADPLINTALVDAELGATILPTGPAAAQQAAWYYNDSGIGWQKGMNPDADFDTNYYLAQNPDVKAAGVDPLTHFEQYGWKEGRQPSLLFDDAKYLNTYTDVKNAGIDPLQHYLQYGQAEGRVAFLTGGAAADPLVNATYYDAQLGATLIPQGTAAAQQAAYSYDQGGWEKGLNPDAFFNTSYYLSHNPDVAAAHIDPLIHYETYGWKEGRDPSAQFSTSKYLNAYADVKAAGVDPLLHYLQYGQAEGRQAFAV